MRFSKKSASPALSLRSFTSTPIGSTSSFRDLQWLGAQVCAARHERHAAVWLLKISQAVTDFDTDERELFVAQIFWNADVAMPAATECWGVGCFGSFVDDGRRVQVDVWAQ